MKQRISTLVIAVILLSVVELVKLIAAKCGKKKALKA